MVLAAGVDWRSAGSGAGLLDTDKPVRSDIDRLLAALMSLGVCAGWATGRKRSLEDPEVAPEGPSPRLNLAVRSLPILLKNSVLTDVEKHLALVGCAGRLMLGGHRKAPITQLRASQYFLCWKWVSFSIGFTSGGNFLPWQFRVFQQNRPEADIPSALQGLCPMEGAGFLRTALEIFV